MNSKLEDISKYVPKIGLGRIILDDLHDYIPRILKGAVTTLSTLALVYSLSACPPPQENGGNGGDDDGEPPIVEKEAEGAKIIYEEAAKRAGVTVGYNSSPVNLTYDTNTVTFVPDVSITKGLLDLHGEFISDTDGLTTQQKGVIDAYNAAPGDPTGKVILASPDTAANIKSSVNKQLDKYGL